MAGKHWPGILAGLMLLGSGLGCKTIRSIQGPVGQPLVMTVAEARTLRDRAWQSYQQQPRTLERVQQAASDLAAAARVLADDYECQVQTAQALAFVAEYATDPGQRKTAAEHGIAAARHGRMSQPDRAPCHYWYAVNVGLLADVDRSYGLDAVGEMKSALERALELDERYDQAGAMRLLAILYLRTPGPPVSMGSARKGLRLMQKAVELVSDYPENRLYLGEAFAKNGRNEQARSEWQRVIAAKPWPDRQWESTKWREQAEALVDGAALP